MAEKFDEFMEEVEKDIRQEKYMNLWNRYGKLLTGIAVVGLVCLIGYNLKSQYDFRQRSKASDILIGAQDYAAHNRHTDAISALKNLADNTVTPYAILAKLNEAGVLSIGEAAQKKQAIQLYQDIMTTTGIDKVWHDIAIYKKVALECDQSDANLDNLLKEIEGADIEHSPFAALIAELKGVILFKKGDKTKAGDIFVKLAQSKTAPEGVIMRSQLMAQIISAS
jgi:hypothetical protein